jgi:hypothetical protein
MSKGVVSFEWLISVTTRQLNKRLSEDEVEMLLENPMNGKKRKMVVKISQLEDDYQFRLKPKIHDDPDNDDGGDAA